MLNVMAYGGGVVRSAFASIIAWRNEPGPESLTLVTTNVPPDADRAVRRMKRFARELFTRQPYHIDARCKT
jgi:SpoVK/Ycf46/Vps4 family AAA+-type ATPase